VYQPAVHWAIALCKEVSFDRLIPKAKVPGVAIVSNAVALQPRLLITVFSNQYFPPYNGYGTVTPE
jgi:hypothetical protein